MPAHVLSAANDIYPGLTPGWGDWASQRLAALAATSSPIVVTDATQTDNPISYANAAFAALCGYPVAEIIGRNCRFLQGPDTDPVVRAKIRAAVESGTSIRREILNYRKDGTPFWNDLTIDPMRDGAGRLVGHVGTQREADRLYLALEAKSEIQARLDSIADRIRGYIYRCVMRIDGTVEVVYCSPSFARMLGIDATGSPIPFGDYVHPDDRDGLQSAIRRSAADMTIFREEFRLVAPSGAVHWIRSDAPPRAMPGGEIVWDGLGIEISAEKRWQTEIADLALRDPLTGLLTRAAWQRAVAMRFGAGGDAERRCSLIYVDIVAFAALNARLGEQVGDSILREVAQRIAAGVAARTAGDEFAILVPARTREGELSRLAHATSEALARPMTLGGQQLSIGTCIGASFRAIADGQQATEGESAGELMTQAELALRWAKETGCNEAVVYSAGQDNRLRNMVILARSLGQAIAGDELELHYQPLVDIASGRILSAEALVRWNHPTLGIQKPDMFIPIAERERLMVPLGDWVMARAIRQHRQWQDAGLAPPPIAINVTGSQLIESGFVQRVAETLAFHSAEARDFEIELTEGQIIEASPQVMTSLHALRHLGFAITIDDFGSGHASFRYLRDFPVDKIKIDQLFVRKLVVGSNDALIIRAVLSLARGMGIRFVAEGIETEMQRAFLEREGCEIGQGFLFSLPLVAADFAAILARNAKLPLRVPEQSRR